MQPGDLVSDRFEMTSLVGIGAMGVVYRARDHRTGADVAVKVLRDEEHRDNARFEREAKVLADLDHPHIVRYVAHGTADADEAYLVMEWIDGEDLGRRLTRGRLPVHECLTLGSHVASALQEAHAHGVIHRDVKPTNLFLPDSEVARVKVLDFGIARLSSMPRATQAGTVLGTPGYLPPEQARGDDVLDPRADVFSLGCVLFECLTGTPAFAGNHLPAILAKILFEPAPRARPLCPDVPEALDALVTRMLSKDPEGRPTSAEAAAALGSLEQLAAEAIDRAGSSKSLPPGGPPSLTSDEQRVLSVVMIGAHEAPGRAGLDTLRKVAEAHGAHLERMADRSMAATPLEALPPLDEAAQAARLALALHAAVPDRQIVMATGRSGGLFKRTIGDAINRAVQLLESCAGEAPGAVLVDEVSARLLEKRFELRAAKVGFAVLGERDRASMERTLLGRAVPYVGRKAELGMLGTLFSECVAESVTHAALVTAPSGYGKSRLAQEFLRTARREAPSLVVWSAQGDALRSGAAFGLLGQALRGVAGIEGGEPVEVSRDKLRAAVAERVPAAIRGRVTEFLGEIAAVPFPDEGSPALWEARTDLRIMREQMLRAFADFLRAECSAHPVVLVLDDLQWSDGPTIRCVGSALAGLKDLPFFVLGLGRPEVSHAFPKLWEDQAACNLRLKELTRKAGAELIERALGKAAATPELVERLLTQADGHALYLEELIRAVAEGHEDTSSETVLALVEARLSQLPAEARRVLRAASVFGNVSWGGGVASLVGDATRDDVARHLDVLVKHEVLARRTDSRFNGEVEYVFCHDMLHEGAYAMLTDADRTLGHRLAARWLEAHGEVDVAVLAEHYGRGGAGERAANAYARAAEQAYQAGDADAAIRHARRGLAFDVPADLRAALLGVICEACMWRFDWGAAASIIEEASSLVRPGSVPWAHVATARFWLAVAHNRFDDVPAELAVIRATTAAPEAVSHVALSLGVGVYVLDMLGRWDDALAALSGLSVLVSPVAARDFTARGWRDTAGAHYTAIAGDDPWRGLGLARASAASFQDAGDRRGLPIALLMTGTCLGLLGAFEEAERTLRSAIVDSALGDFALVRDYSLAHTLFARGALDAAEQAAEKLIARSRELAIPRHEGRGHWVLAEVLLRMGDLAGAAREVAVALEQMSPALVHRLLVQVLEVSVRLAEGRAEDALRVAEEARQRSEARGIYGVVTRLALAEALDASGDHASARETLDEAHALVSSAAQKIEAPALRRTFLERVPEHARIVQLTHAWRTLPSAG